MNIPQWNQNEGWAEFVLGMPLISAGCASLLLIMCHHHGVLWAHAENTLICIGINMIENIPYACTFNLQSTNIKSLIIIIKSTFLKATLLPGVWPSSFIAFMSVSFVPTLKLDVLADLSQCLLWLVEAFLKSFTRHRAWAQMINRPLTRSLLGYVHRGGCASPIFLPDIRCCGSSKFPRTFLFCRTPSGTLRVQ